MNGVRTPSDFLERILSVKRQEVASLQARRAAFQDRIAPACRGFASSILNSPQLAVVAEVKKASPSKGLIQPQFNPVATAMAYESAGAACVSVLTDETFFQGRISDMASVRQAISRPVLRKDFIIDEVQIDEAYSCGADAVLLICAALTADRLAALSEYAQAKGLDVLVEVHEESELEPALAAKPSVLGVNNRNLATFEVHLETSERLIPLLPPDLPILAESGIRGVDDALRMAACGARGVLVGESLMRNAIGIDLEVLLRQLMVPLTVNGKVLK